MRRAPKKPSPGERTRYLNIVYFVESARSHTIRVNLTHARLAVVGLAMVGVWAIASGFWIAQLNYQSVKTRQRLETALTTIFDYQIKSEKVFDQAYPPESSKSYYSEAAQLPSNNPLTEPTPTESTKQNEKRSDKPTPTLVTTPKIEPTTESVTAPAEGKSKQAIQVTAGITTPISSKHAEAPVEKPSSAEFTELDISAAKLTKADNKIALNFSIKNKRPQRSEGFIWAVAMISNETGTTKPLVAPEHTKIDTKSGDILSARSAYRFSILKFKNKEFEFKIPGSATWKLTKLTVHHTDLKGGNEQRVEIPVEQVATTNVADTPEANSKL
jgi:hypothetical protein